MNIIIKENKNIIKSKQKLFDDEYLNILVNIIVEDNYNTLLTSIKYFFYITDETNYTKQYYLMKIRYSNQIEKCEKIYKLFKKWKPYEKYNMGECRGTFLELLSNKLLTKKYSENNIFRESKIIIDNYQSHTWDNICIHDKNINSNS